MTRREELTRQAPRAIALVAVACLGLGIAWTLDAGMRVDVHEQVHVRDAWGERGEFTYEPLLADGSALPPGEPGYFTSEAPTVRVGIAWTLDDANAERVTALGTLRLVVEQRGAATRAWTHEVAIAEATHSGATHEPLHLEGVVDLADAAEAISATRGRDPGDATWRVVATVRFVSAPTESHAADASTFDLPIRYHPPLYVLPAETALTSYKDHTQRQTVTEHVPVGAAGLLREPIGPGLVLLGLAGLRASLPSMRPEEETP